MWQTPLGTRVLVGAEAHLFKKAVSLLRIWLEDAITVDPSFCLPTDISQFDLMHPEQKLLLIAEIAQGLLDPHIPPTLPLDSCYDVTAAAIYQHFHTEMTIEDIVGEELRQLVGITYQEIFNSGEYESIISKQDNLTDWTARLEKLKNRVAYPNYPAIVRYPIPKPIQVKKAMKYLKSIEV